MKKVLIAMSGGVDSSVAAALMTCEGYECIGCTMKLLDQNDVDMMDAVCGGGHDSVSGAEAGALSGPAADAASGDEFGSARPAHSCCSLDDVEDARSVARKLGIPYYVFNFADDFGEKVIDRFVRTYQSGGTPNPCIDCNRYMKFDKLFHRARVLGCDAVVTGHYARIRYDDRSGRWQLLRSENKSKDQTYVLYSMTQEMLSHTLFPLGVYKDKEAVRALADEYGFVNSDKPDSQDICFVQSGKYADFIEKHTGTKAPWGDFVDEEGHVLGTHKGLIRYTVGQRKGLGLALPAPLYVNRIDTKKNQVVLTPEERLYSRKLIAEDFNWIWTPDWGEWDTAAGQEFSRDDLKCDQQDDQQDTQQNNQQRGVAQPLSDEDAFGMPPHRPPEGYTLEVTAKPRYRAKEAAATIRVLEGGKVEVEFHDPQRALTIGQAVVLYVDDIVVGGGTISAVPA